MKASSSGLVNLWSRGVKRSLSLKDLTSFNDLLSRWVCWGEGFKTEKKKKGGGKERKRKREKEKERERKKKKDRKKERESNFVMLVKR